MSKNDGRDVVAACFGLGWGVMYFFKGFDRLKLRRKIAGLATSKVRSMAMGTVELDGRARLAAEISDPIFGLPCALFRVKVEEKRGKNWVTVYQADSFSRPFYLEDETGRVPVFPAGADLLAERDALALDDPPVARFLRAQGCEGSFGSQPRLEAYIIRPDEHVHLVGYAAPADDPMTPGEKVSRAVKRPLAELARRLKADKARMERLDLDKDGRISAFEWDIGLEAYRREQAASPEESGPVAALIRAGPDGFLFISDEREEDCLAELGKRAFLGIFGGPALALACAAYLAVRLGLLPAPF